MIIRYVHTVDGCDIGFERSEDKMVRQLEYRSNKLQIKITRDQLIGLDRETKTDVVINWLHDNYDNIINIFFAETENNLISYRDDLSRIDNYVLGELIEEFFDIIGIDILLNAYGRIKEIKTNTSKQDSFFDYGLGGSGIVDANSEWPPIILHMTEAQARAELKLKLKQLEILTEQELAKENWLGHNNPPSSITDTPLSRDDCLSLKITIEITNKELASERPSQEVVEKASSTFSQIAQKISVWIGRRLEIGVDAFTKGIGTSAGTAMGTGLAASVFVGPQKIYNALMAVIEAVKVWAHTL